MCCCGCRRAIASASADRLIGDPPLLSDRLEGLGGTITFQVGRRK
jgi:hypothetical protein